MYSLYKLDDSVREHAEKHFDLICPGENGHEHWRSQADGVMLRGETISSEDVQQLGDNLKFVSKHGVGVDRLDIKGLRARGITITNTPGVNVGRINMRNSCILPQAVSSGDSRAEKDIGKLIDRRLP